MLLYADPAYCCVVLCHYVLCCVVLCTAVLCCVAVLCCAVLMCIYVFLLVRVRYFGNLFGISTNDPPFY